MALAILDFTEVLPHPRAHKSFSTVRESCRVISLDGNYRGQMQRKMMQEMLLVVAEKLRFWKSDNVLRIIKFILFLLWKKFADFSFFSLLKHLVRRLLFLNQYLFLLRFIRYKTHSLRLPSFLFFGYYQHFLRSFVYFLFFDVFGISFFLFWSISADPTSYKGTLIHRLSPTNKHTLHHYHYQSVLGARISLSHHHHHHQEMLTAHISLTLTRHRPLSAIALGKTFRRCTVCTQSWWL